MHDKALNKHYMGYLEAIQGFSEEVLLLLDAPLCLTQLLAHRRLPRLGLLVGINEHERRLIR